jgi:hypothetical protein
MPSLNGVKGLAGELCASAARTLPLSTPHVAPVAETWPGKELILNFSNCVPFGFLEFINKMHEI